MAETQNQRLPQDVAKHLFSEGAILIVAGVPTGTDFGIDLDVNKVDELFRGVKMIPPGPHYVYTAAEGLYGDVAARVGFMHYYKRQEIVIREWDDQTEELKERPSTSVALDEARVRRNILDIDRFLAPYNYEENKKWQQFSGEINETVISRTVPESGIVRTTAEFQSCTDAERPKGQTSLTQSNKPRQKQSEDDLLPNLKVVPGTSLRFTNIPPLHAPDASPAEISKCHLDGIDAIAIFFSSFSDHIEPFREVQLSFVLYLCGYSVDALAHWRKILGLLCKSDTAAAKYSSFYRKYLQVLKVQLPELPEELMMPTPNNTVYQDTKQLVKICNVALKEETEAFMQHITNEMAWDFDDVLDEDPDDLPVVVDCSEIDL